jgi:hypothetical protein
MPAPLLNQPRISRLRRVSGLSEAKAVTPLKLLGGAVKIGIVRV